MRKFLCVAILVMSAVLPATASHNIAGEITYRCMGGSNYEITVHTYTNTGTNVNRYELLVDFGDGNTQWVSRTNGQFNTTYNACEGDLLAQYPGIRYSEYKIVHPYSSGTYSVSISDPNRVYGIDNIPNSFNIPFYIESVLTVDPFVGCNTGPILKTYPLDKACRGACFYHNPGAYDADGDSLAFSTGPCLDTTGQPITPYYSPDHPAMGGGTLTIDPVTGDIAWCSPQVAGTYNLVIYIEEWRKINGNWVMIGRVLRDMSIEVLNDCNNTNPEIPNLPDLCVDAGALVNFSFNVSDPENDSVRTEAFGGMFLVIPSASISPDSIMTPTTYSVDFTWQTNCERVRAQPWTVVFKATDNGNTGNGVVLSDIESVNITVVSQGPATLSASPQGTNMNLAWSASPCMPVGNKVAGYKIYRHIGPSGWNPWRCETGVPQPLFELIGVVGPNTTTFVDNDAGTGLVQGITYCYRVHTFFLDGAESYASPEACSELMRDVPVITHVDITSTGTSGSIDVRWINPLANGIDFDTIANPGPYTLNIYRTDNDYVMQPNAVLAGTLTATSFYLLPTLFQDFGINTADEPHTYRIEFSGQNAAPVNSHSASSVFLTTIPSDNQVLLSWRDTTPWTNSAYAIFRFNTTTSSWDSIAFVTGNSYVDAGLVNGEEFCYYVKSHGSYFNTQLPSPLLNRSQQKCDRPVDLTPPCPPVLVVNSDCFIGMNQLIWTNPNNMNCGTDDVVTYNIWFTPVSGGDMSVIQTISLSSDTVFVISNMFSVAGCYAVTAIDTFGNQSALSNLVCVDNCPNYSLPNVFTPNADGTNDYFIPFPYRYIESIDISIYDRWGALVFQTTDPDIMWNGRDMKTGRLCVDGVYYYTCTVNEIHLEGIVPRKISGFVHLFGKDIATD